MSEKRGFFEKVNDSRTWQVVFFLVSMCVIWGIFFGCTALIDHKKSIDKAHEYILSEDTNVIKYVEETNIENGIFSLSGWCFYKGISSDKYELQVFLKNLADEEDIVWLNVERVTREDVDAYFDSENDYSQAGFKATIKEKKLNVNEKEYEIFIKLAMTDEDAMKHNIGKTGVTVSAKRYLRQGKVSAFAKEEDRPSDSASSVINDIFENGQLLVYRKDFDMYIYQKGKDLYWVAGRTFDFEEDKSTVIQVQLGTTRTDLLPEKSIIEERKIDDIRYTFEEDMISDEQENSYRVVRKQIPLSYPITNVWTGYYAEQKWVWQECINLDIRALR